MLRLNRPFVGHRPSFRAFNALILLLGMASSALAAIDAQLNTTGFTPGQASEVSVDGLIYSGGTSTSINGAMLTLRFDPTDVTLSGVRPASGWTLQGANLDHASEG